MELPPWDPAGDACRPGSLSCSPPAPVAMSAPGTSRLRARAFRRVVRVIALACTLGVPASASAQRLQFSKITADDGLAGPWVASIYQDSRGFMWFGTRRGLDRFDGYTIRNFRKIRDDSTSIASNYINFVAEDRDSVLWVGTRTGVSRYDRAHESFRSYQVSGERQVLSMAHAKNGTLWFGADNGLFQFDKASGKATRYAGSPTVVGKTIQVVTEDRRGHLWIGTKENGAVDLDPASGSARAYPGSLGAVSGLPDGDVRAIIEDESGMMWVGTYHGGLVRIDPASGTETRFQHDPSNPRSLNLNAIQTMARAGRSPIRAPRPCC